MMKLHEQIETIDSKASLAKFVEALRRDLQENPQEWENATLDQFLAALASWIEDSDGYYVNQGRPIPVSPSWRNVAEMLIAAKIYE
jgi:hypothetical protein